VVEVAPQEARFVPLPVVSPLLADDYLQLIVMPTEKCNFACPYCYESFALGRMKAWTVSALVRLLERRARDLRFLDLSWFGGEPLLAYDIVRDVSAAAADLSRAHGFAYRGSMTTNGYTLTLARLAELGEVGVREFKVTVDGPASAHDRRRMLLNGGGTFERIWSHLGDALASTLELRIVIRINVDAENAGAVGRWIQTLEPFLADDRFAFEFSPVKRWGGPNDAELPVLPADSPVVEELERLVGDRCVAEPTFDVCYASTPSAFVVRSDGRLGKCTIALDDPRNDIGRLNPDGTLTLDQPTMRPWLRGLATLDAETLACPARGLPPTKAEINSGR
jgi:uncharacterized protein